MKYKNLLKDNLKFIIAMIAVITLGVIGITLAINIDTFNPIGINIGTAQLGANITYLNNSSASITSKGKLLPVNDSSTEINPNTTNENILKIDFKLSGVSTNPNNTIMDISLNNIKMSCYLKSKNFKWKLYKNGTLLNNGDFSPSFDTMQNNRLLLTNTQEDLTAKEDTYSLIIYIAESCTGDIANCNNNKSEYDESELLNNTFNATMKIELSTGSKKNNTRTTSNINACDSESVAVPTEVPTCNNLTYNDASQTLITSSLNGTDFTLTNNTGINAGNYIVIAELKNGFIWLDNTTSSKAITCSIAKKEITIIPSNQTITKGNNIDSAVSKVTVNGLISGHSISYVHLYTDSYNTGSGTIYASAARISDSSGNDVTSNYDIVYNTGTVTIQ